MKILFRISLALALLIPTLSEAAIFVEPSLTQESGTLVITNPTTFSGDQDEKVSGLGVGLRAGLHFYEVLFAAADVRYSRPRYESEAMNGSADATAHNLGVTLGGQVPLFGLRVWGTSILDGQLNPETINAADVKYTGFKGYRVGAGIKILLVSLNLEYQEAKYNTGELESFGPFTSGATAGLDGMQKSYIVSVSFPFAN
jgi:hypothetical protein